MGLLKYQLHYSFLPLLLAIIVTSLNYLYKLIIPQFIRNISIQSIGKEVKFQVDYTIPHKGLDFGTVFLGDKNVAFYVVAQGWAKLKTVRDFDKDKGEFSPYLKDLKKWEDKAKENGSGCWSKTTAGAVRYLPPSLVGDQNSNNVMTRLVAENRGEEVKAIVEYVRDGSTLHVYLLPDFHHVRVFVAGVQAPSIRDWSVEPAKTEANGKPSNGSRAPLTSTSETQGAPQAFGRESKHFTEIRVLHRDGLAKYVDCGTFLPVDVKRRLKSSELEAKKSRLRMWNNYMSPPTDNRAMADQNFTGKVVQVVSGDCIVVASDSLEKRRVYLSSIRCPRLVNGRTEGRGKAREVLEKYVIGHQVHVSLEYYRKVNAAEGPGSENRPAAVMEFGSVFIETQSRSPEDAPPALPAASSQHQRTNIAEMLVARGFAEVIRHRDFEVRSSHYDALLDAECQAKERMQSDKKCVEGQKVSNGQAIDRVLKGEFQVVATEIVGGGKFYVQLAADQKEASIIQQQLASLKLQEAPALGSFNPEKGELVLAQFKGDNSWNRAMIVDVPQGVVRSSKARFEVFYIDFGNQEFVAYSHLRPWDYSVKKSPGLAHLCGLAHVKVPSWKDNYGKEAALCLTNHILRGQKEFKAILKERNTSGGEGAKTILMVTLMDTNAKMSINAAMVKDGFARVEEAAVAADELKKYQEEARKQRLGMWKNGDIIISGDDKKPTVRKAGGKR